VSAKQALKKAVQALPPPDMKKGLVKHETYVSQEEEEEVVEVVPSTIKFLEGGDKGFNQKSARFNMDASSGDAYNSPYVYNNNVGGEQVDGS
jgi:hypothetical protein